MRPHDHAFFQVVAGGSWFGADQSAVSSDEPIQQTALTRVRLAEDHGLDAVAQEFSITICRQQPIGPGKQLHELALSRLPVLRWEILVRKIDIRLDRSQQTDE